MARHRKRQKAGAAAQGRRAERPRTYKTLGGLARAMGGRQQGSLETIFSQRANLKGKGWSPIKYNLTYADATEIAELMRGRQYTKRNVRNGHVDASEVAGKIDVKADAGSPLGRKSCRTNSADRRNNQNPIDGGEKGGSDGRCQRFVNHRS